MDIKNSKLPIILDNMNESAGWLTMEDSISKLINKTNIKKDFKYIQTKPQMIDFFFSTQKRCIIDIEGNNVGFFFKDKTAKLSKGIDGIPLN